MKLPDVFTKEDVTKCFGYDNNSATMMRLKRLLDSCLIEEIEDGANKGKYRKINTSAI